MSATAGGMEQGRNRALWRTGLLVGAVLASLAMLSLASSSAEAKTDVGVYISGEASEEKAKQPKIEAESYPTDLIGPAVTEQVFTFKVGTWKCFGAEFHGELTGATAQLLLSPAYLGCTPPVGTPQIRMNSCEFALPIANAGPPYVGQLDIVCPPTDEIEFQYTSVFTCIIKIPPQTGLKNVSYTNTGSGNKRAVSVNFNITGLDYAVKGLTCPKAGEYTDGTYTGTISVKGYHE